jgi:hypothetical protein
MCEEPLFEMALNCSFAHVNYTPLRVNQIRIVLNEQKSITLHVKGVAEQYITSIKPTTIAFEE